MGTMPTAARSRRGVGMWGRRAASVAVMAVMAASAGMGASMAAPQNDAARPTVLAATMQDPVTATLTSIAPTYLTASSALTVRLELAAGAAGATGVSTSVALTAEPLRSAREIDAFVAQPDAALARVVYRTSTDDPTVPATLLARTTTPVNITVLPEALTLGDSPTGVYGVLVTTRAAGMEPVIQPFVIAVVNTPLPRLDTAVIATVSGGPGRIAALLSAAADSRTALVIDSVAVAQLPEPADLDGREVYLLPGAHLDLTSATHGDALGVLDFSLARSAASPWGERPWLAFPGVLDDAVVEAAVSRGALAAVATTRMESGWPPAEVTRTPVVISTSAAGATLPTLLTHQRLSHVLASSPASDATAPARLVAESALVALTTADASQTTAGTVLIAPGDQWIVDGTRASAELAALYAAPWIHPVTVQEVLDAGDAPAAPAPVAVSSPFDASREQLSAVSTTLHRLEVLASATDNPSAVLDVHGHALLSSLALPLRVDPAGREAAVTVALDTAAAVLGSVRVTSSSELTLVSTSGRVPVTVRNDLPYAVTVVVAMTSRSPNLLVDEQPTVTIAPQTEQTVLVPVTAVSSDDVRVSVALRTQDGVTLTMAQTLTMRVRAEWGSAATGLATAALVVLLLAGIYRTIRRGRRDTRMGPTEDPAVEGSLSSETSAS